MTGRGLKEILIPSHGKKVWAGKGRREGMRWMGRVGNGSNGVEKKGEMKESDGW